MNSKLKWITRSAAAIALIVVLQFVTAPLKQQLLTGSLVNLVLALSTLLFGWSVGAVAAVVSPAPGVSSAQQTITAADRITARNTAVSLMMSFFILFSFFSYNLERSVKI